MINIYIFLNYFNRQTMISTIKENFSDLLKQAKQANESSIKTAIKTESYQQAYYHNVRNKKNDLLANLNKVQSNIKSRILNKIVKDSNYYAASIISQAEKIYQLMQDLQELGMGINITHRQKYSESILLSIYFQCRGCKTAVITSQSNKKSWQKILAGSQESDPQGFIDSQLQKQQIKIVTLKNNCQIPSNYDVVIVDIFNCSQYFYKPLLLGKLSQILQKNKKFILYSANYQQQSIIKLISLENISEKLLDIPISTMQPFETIQQTDPLKYLINFLTEQQNHPNKQDCIIFYKKPKEESLNQFIHNFNKRIHQSILSQKNLNIITKPNQQLSKEKNTIFIVSGTKQLENWKYNLDDVFLIVDYGYEENYYFDYDIMCYANQITQSSPIQTAKRMNYVGINKIGRYLYKTQYEQVLQQKSKAQIQNYYDISKYCCQMIATDNQKFLEKDNQRVRKCLEILKNMKILEQKNGKLLMNNPDILKYSITPIFAQLILKIASQSRLANLMIMMIACMENNGSLKQQKKDILIHKATKIPPIWRQSGYLHSALDILTKSQLLQHGAHLAKLSSKKSKSMVKKQTSAGQEESLFGNLFMIIQPKKLTFDQMQIGDFITECFVNQQILLQIEQRVDALRDQFQIQRQDIYLQQADIEKVIQKYVTLHQRGVGVYSGSRRVGYLLTNLSEGLFPHKKSLISILNEKPSYLYIFRIQINNAKKQIQMSNSLSQQCYTSCMGKLPIKEKKSYSQSEIEFHGISTATIKELQNRFKSQLQQLEQKYQCLVEPNEEMSMIIIYTHKNYQQTTKDAFQGILDKIRQKISRNTKIVPYLGGTKVMLGSGGNITEIIKENYINKCQVSNLPAFCTSQDLHDLFDEFFTLKNIQMVQGDNKFKSSAIVEFFSQKDFYLFHQYFNQCLYGDRYIYVKPITMNIEESFQQSMYLKFQWNVWKSHQKAIIEFNEEQSAQKAYNNLCQNPTFDNKKIEVKRQSSTKIILENLKSKTDEIFIEKALQQFGAIKMVEVLRTPIKQSLKQQQILDYHIKNCFAENVRYRMQPIQKKKNGLRIAHVFFKEQAKMKKVFQDLDNQEGIIGVGRVYLTQRYLYPILIPPTMTNLYQQLLQEVIASLPKDLLGLIKSSIQIGKDEKTYLLLKAKRKDVGDNLNNKFINSLKGYAIQLTDLQKNIVLNQIGMDNIMDLQLKYPCKLIPNFLKKTLDIIAPHKLVKKINEEILFKIQESFFYRVPLNDKSFKYFKAHPEKYECLVNTYHLKFAELEEMSKSILLDGSAIHVQNSFSYLMHIIQSLMVPEQQLKNADVCQVCFEQFHRPYRLQKCGHKFCASCIIQSINMALGDISLFPVKCPHCLVELAIDDLQFLIGENQWNRVINMAMNQYIGKNPQHYTYCFNAGCKQVNAINLNYFCCDLCNNSFCLICKLNYHPGMSCEEAKQGGDIAFKKFMEQNNIRKCPYEKCGMPIERSDGCFRVTCLRCGKSMCFKCQPDKMIAYDHYNDCYKHLTDVHGGYW